MSDLLTEADEMMRQERMEKIWHDHWKTIIGSIAFIIIATASYSGYHAWDDHVKTSQTERLINAVDAPNFPENVTTEDHDLKAGPRALLQLQAARRYAEDGEMEKARGLYNDIAGNKKTPQDLRQLAALMSIRLSAQSENANTSDTLEKLENIWSDGNSPWRFHAFMEAAQISANMTGDYKKAQEYLRNVTAEANIPPSLKERAAALLDVYSLKALDQK